LASCKILLFTEPLEIFIGRIPQMDAFIKIQAAVIHASVGVKFKVRMRALTPLEVEIIFYSERMPLKGQKEVRGGVFGGGGLAIAGLAHQSAGKIDAVENMTREGGLL
jgi:hypothetical protein